MAEDFAWEDNEVQGFQFDWDQSEKLNIGEFEKTIWDAPSINDPSTESSCFEDLEQDACVVCHKIVGDNALYEYKVTFCSESCWESAICTAVNDLAIGGMSSWPLETFTSLSSKIKMLDIASKAFDGTLIIKLTRYFQSSLSARKFAEVLFGNRVAFNHFASFLRKTGTNEQYQELLMSHGDVEHAKIQTFNKLVQGLDTLDAVNTEYLTHKLRVFAMTELVNDSKLSLLHETVTQLSDLLHYQLHLPHTVSNFASPSNKPENGESTHSLLALTLRETIRACSLIDKSIGVGSRVNGLKSQFKICDDQFLWFVVEPLALKASWTEMDTLILQKKRLKRRTESYLPIDRLLQYLHLLGAPSEILCNYLSYSSYEDVLDIALPLRMYSAALRYCWQRKDSVAMKTLLDRIPKNAPEHAEALYYLSLSVSQWKDNKPKD